MTKRAMFPCFLIALIVATIWLGIGTLDHKAELAKARQRAAMWEGISHAHRHEEEKVKKTLKEIQEEKEYNIRHAKGLQEELDAKTEACKQWAASCKKMELAIEAAQKKQTEAEQLTSVADADRKAAQKELVDAKLRAERAEAKSRDLLLSIVEAGEKAKKLLEDGKPTP